MASLKNGVLLKLLESIKTEENAFEDDRKPVLLQIRSIIPVLEEGDFYPNRGFYLKVSDSSHALYVSLPQEQNEMILGNKLKLGQFIYVTKLEKSEPVPLLRGLTPVPGRRQCEGAPEDIIPQTNFLKLLDASCPIDSIVEKGVIMEKKIPGVDLERSLNDIFGEWHNKSRPSSVDNDSDADSVVSSTSLTRISKRRSWNESEIMGVKEIFDSSIVKHEIKPPRSRSANVSPVRSMRYDSSDDNSSTKSRRRGSITCSTRRPLAKSTNKLQRPIVLPAKINNEQVLSSLCSLVYDRKGAETGISWNSLPSNLVKLGKEVLRQRDIALLAATDALQEACAAERLLNSLSTLSEFPLADGDDLQQYGDKFFDLQDDLSKTRLIMESLTSISPFKTRDTESCTTNSIKDTLSVAIERKKNATTWIKSAIALDLSPSSPSPNPVVAPTAKKPCTLTKSKSSSIIKKTRSNADIPRFLAFDKEEQHEWTRGSTLSAAADLATPLQDESKKLFLSYAERYLEEVERKSSCMESDGSMAEMMCKVKMVSEWLDLIVHKEGNGSICLEDSEVYGRVRKKIYAILLKHVERTAMAFT
ncbi:hypothetical protein ACJIZ3_015580 [Penstemon smallii]|uniref:Uncharacterized protein n=1 Tax=Penstemon smallii TaxID=265156 RepID=A0ABD3RQ75_9LAMI